MSTMRLFFTIFAAFHPISLCTPTPVVGYAEHSLAFFLLFFQHLQIYIQPMIDVSCKQVFHGFEIMFDMVVIKSFLMAYCLNMIFERFSVYHKTPQDKVGFSKRKCIAFCSVRIVCEFNGNFFLKSFQLSLCEGSSAV